MRTDNAYFLTGTDEHGAKMEKVAKDNGKEIMEYLDGVTMTHQEFFEKLIEKLKIYF